MNSLDLIVKKISNGGNVAWELMEPEDKKNLVGLFGKKLVYKYNLNDFTRVTLSKDKKVL